MTASVVPGPSGSGNNQEPSLLYIPEYVSTTGVEAVQVCEVAGLVLDPWQRFVLIHALGERANHKWAAFEVVEEVPRQNGKTLGAVARELVGLFLLGERLLIHSAHQFDTSLEAFRNLVQIIEETPDFDSQVKKITRSHGEEGIELKSGQRIRFRTRTKGGGRGFTSDCLILDECMILPEATIGALMPTLSARPNPQVWYLGSAVDQEVHEDGIVFARLRNRAKEARPGESLAYFGWCLPYNHPNEVPREVAEDSEAHKRANPGYGIRISGEHIEREQASMDPRTFAVERLGVGDWPDPDGENLRPITPAMWASRIDVDSQPADPLCLVFDVSEDRRYSAIGIAGHRGDGLDHVEIVAYREGTGWVADEVLRLAARHNFVDIATLATGPGAALVPDLQAADLEEVRLISTAEHAAACGMLYDAVAEATICHLGTEELQSAIAGSIRRPLLDRWAWSRKDSTIDISPLMAITLALWGLRSGEDGVPEVHSIREAVERKRAAESVEPGDFKPNTTTSMPPGFTDGGAPTTGWVPL